MIRFEGGACRIRRILGVLVYQEAPGGASKGPF